MSIFDDGLKDRAEFATEKIINGRPNYVFKDSHGITKNFEVSQGIPYGILDNGLSLERSRPCHRHCPARSQRQISRVPVQEDV